MSILHNFLSVVLLFNLARAVPFLKNELGDIDLHANTIIEYRLPRHVVPSHYTIQLKPNIEVGAFTFTGKSHISIAVSEFSKNITLHAKDLKFTAINLISDTLKIIQPSTIETVNETDFLILTFEDFLLGKYTLNLEYEGKLHDDLKGFYRSSYVNKEGKEVWLASTQFEPTYARRAFPCFDEPALKATFKISIHHKHKFKAISNTHVLYTIWDDKNVEGWTHFRDTPKMSTYLIAFVVSDFSELTNEKHSFAVWSRPNAIQNGHYAFNTGLKELEVLDNYTGIEYISQINKMDNFAIPQFGPGAMENWGIVTYRESALLYEENVTSTDSKQGIATVISHEFAHQWFGNLVSPLWWDFAWLNEGFANYFQYYITNEVEKTWRLMDQFVIKNLQETAFTADDKADQHPMNGNVSSPKEISAFFDSITYSKAGCVIRMFSHGLTEIVFKTGIQAYLKKMSYQAATPTDLFVQLEKAAVNQLPKVDVVKAFTSWADQPGYPVITVIRNYTARSASITQHRFLTKKSELPKKNYWIIPINYASESDANFNDTKPSLWLPNEDKSTEIKEIKDGWIVFNTQQTGYYRVNYDGNNWSLLIKQLKSVKYEDIHVLNRAQILDDSFHLAQAGELKYDVFLEISTYLKQEVDYAPWYAASRAFGVLNKALANTEKYDLLKLYVLRLIEKLEKSVNYTETDKDDHVTKLKRIITINLACSMGSKNCAGATHDKLVKHVLGSSKISTDLLNVVLCAGIRTANVTIWEKTFDYYNKSKDETERKAILTALGCSTNSKLLNYLLEKSIATKSNISTDAINAVLVGSTVGVDIVFDFINGNFTRIKEIDGIVSIQKYLKSIGSRMNTDTQVKKLEAFFDAHKELTKVPVDNAKSNIEWIKTHESMIATFLDAQNLVAKSNPNSSSGFLPALQLILLTFIASGITWIY